MAHEPVQAIPFTSAKLWRDFMAAAHAGLPPRPLPGLKDVPLPGQETVPPLERAPEKEKPGFWKSLFATISGGEG